MDTWVWIVVAVGAIVVAALFLLSARRARQRRLESNREEARGLRQEAEARARLAEERSAIADELAEKAQAGRREAELATQRADEIDPDVESR